MDEIDNHEVIRTTLKTNTVKFKASSVVKMDTISTWFIETGSDILDSLQ